MPKLTYESNPRGRQWLAQNLEMFRRNKALRYGEVFKPDENALVCINAFFETAEGLYTLREVCDKQELIYEAYQAALEWDAEGDVDLQKTIDTQREMLVVMDCLMGMVRQEMKGSVMVPREPAIWPLEISHNLHFVDDLQSAVGKIAANPWVLADALGDTRAWRHLHRYILPQKFNNFKRYAERAGIVMKINMGLTSLQ